MFVVPWFIQLYINDLACKIKSLNKGVRLQNENMSILMYADDLVLMAEKEGDLQEMLDALNEWCMIWGVRVNEQKTKVKKHTFSSCDRTFKCLYFS